MPACPTGAKQSMDRSYLPQAVERGTRIYADCRAEELFVRKGQVCGVQGVFRDPLSGRPGGSIVVNAKAVVLAAGVMDSPVLLLKNRVGNSSGWVGGNLVHHQRGAGILHLLAVDVGLECEVVRVGNVVTGNDARPQGAKSVQPFGADPVFVLVLEIAGSHIIGNGITEHII